MGYPLSHSLRKSTQQIINSKSPTLHATLVRYGDNPVTRRTTSHITGQARSTKPDAARLLVSVIRNWS